MPGCDLLASLGALLEHSGALLVSLGALSGLSWKSSAIGIHILDSLGANLHTSGTLGRYLGQKAAPEYESEYQAAIS